MGLVVFLREWRTASGRNPYALPYSLSDCGVSSGEFGEDHVEVCVATACRLHRSNDNHQTALKNSIAIVKARNELQTLRTNRCKKRKMKRELVLFLQSLQADEGRYDS